MNVRVTLIHALLPAGACTIIDYTRDDGSASPFPLIRCDNVFVLPGVPDLLRSKWKVKHIAFACGLRLTMVVKPCLQTLETPCQTLLYIHLAATACALHLSCLIMHHGQNWSTSQHRETTLGGLDSPESSTLATFDRIVAKVQQAHVFLC